jgi:membrane protease YdiL (CAAX protease family)
MKDATGTAAAQADVRTMPAVFGLLFVCVVALTPWGGWLPDHSLMSKVINEALWWCVGAALLAWVLFVEHLPLASIGIRKTTGGTVVRGLGAAALMLASVMLSYAVIFPLIGASLNERAVASITHTPIWLQSATMIRAGVVEEILFRGYAIERLRSLSGSTWLAAVASGALFIAAHVASWELAQLIVVGFGTLILTLLYVWKRDLVSNMIAHGTTDFFGFLLARMQGA